MWVGGATEGGQVQSWEDFKGQKSKKAAYIHYSWLYGYDPKNVAACQPPTPERECLLLNNNNNNKEKLQKIF